MTTMRTREEIDRELLRIASMFAIADLREESSTRLHVRGVQLIWVLNPDADWLQGIAMFHSLVDELKAEQRRDDR